MTPEELQDIKAEAWAAGWLHCYNLENDREAGSPLPDWLGHFVPVYNPHHRSEVAKRVQSMTIGTASEADAHVIRKRLIEFLEMDAYLASHGVPDQHSVTEKP